MTLAVTGFKAWGVGIDEPLTKKFHQFVKLSYSRISDGDGDVNLSKRASLVSGDFWFGATEIIALARQAYGDIITKSEMLAKVPVVIETVSAQAHLATIADATPAAYNEFNTVIPTGSISLSDVDVVVYDAAAGTTAITGELLLEFVLKDGHIPVRYGM